MRFGRLLLAVFALASVTATAQIVNPPTAIGPGIPFSWGNPPDLSLSREGPGILDCGTGAQGDKGCTLKLTRVTPFIIGELRYAVQYQFSQSPVSPVSIAVGANTVTLTPCPLGVNGTDTNHPVRIAGTGTPEDALITGGTCTGGATTGTIIFTAANTHAAGYTITSSTAGVKEAWVDMPDGGGTYVEGLDHNLTYGFFTDAHGGTLLGSGSASHLTGDPGARAIITINNGVTFTHPVRVTGLRISNTHTIADNSPQAILVKSGSSFQIDHNIFDNGKYGVLVTSSGGGGQTENGEIDHNSCYGATYGGSLKDACTQVNGDGSSLPSLSIDIHSNFSGDLATSGISGPPHDFYAEDCDRCLIHDNTAIDINGFSESTASAAMLFANHDASLNHSRIYHNNFFYIGTTPTYAGMTGLTGASKTYLDDDYTDNVIVGYKGGIVLQSTSAADYLWNGVKIAANKIINSANTATAALYVAASGAQQRNKFEVVGNVINGTGTGSSVGIRCDLMRGGTIARNTVRLMGASGLALQGCSDMTIGPQNSLTDNGQNATADGLRLNSQGGVGSSNNQIFGNDLSDYQASPTQNRGGNNNDTVNNTGNNWSGNKAFNNITAPINDTEATAQFGVNFWNVSGTNKAGINQPFSCTAGTGTGAGCKIQFNVYDTQTTGTTAHVVHTLESWNSATAADPNNDTAQFLGAHGEVWERFENTELLTLSTSGTTTDTANNLLPANSIIESVVARVTTTITTATDWKLGDPTTAGRFSAANATLTAGTTQVGLVHSDQTGAAGPKQTAAAKVRVTTTGTPGAGVIRITVFGRRFVAPTS